MTSFEQWMYLKRERRYIIGETSESEFKHKTRKVLKITTLYNWSSY